MSVILTPYLNFRDTAREAIEFYHSVFGGDLTISTFGEMGMGQDPSESDKVMHSMLTAPNGLVLMAADTPDRMDYTPGTNFSVSLSGDDTETLTRYWESLSDGATIVEPLSKAPWGDSFGMLNDRFGISWLVNISGS
ncbi:VOC family protein [Amnibacterium flavum]|uniref:PhnB-like domain-containing protein n=1 Tax=Amnibacterium flavum TaxID=2173173 RepID=A0A2V1HP44_9MICO|nr:VOC family protein [Amnibacterium flavum]PVZ94295.1 hypothetical protein DDQ50_11195 [Amnibacterium flavum]